MTIAELKELISKYPDGMEMVVSNVKEALQFTGDADIMYFVPKTKELYLKAENAEKDGKAYQKVLVLWAMPNEL